MNTSAVIGIRVIDSKKPSEYITVERAIRFESNGEMSVRYQNKRYTIVSGGYFGYAAIYVNSIPIETV